MDLWNRLYFKRKSPQHKGQAILELAIFGSILIMLLGILINYGLRYNYQQRVMQQAFRQALATAAVSMAPGTPISTSHILVRDKHIPNPSDPFAVGSVMPFSSGASIVRSYKLDETPDTEDELPQVIIDIQGEKIPFKTAGFREEEIPQDSLARYEEIYGSGNVWETGEAAATGKIGIKIIDSCAGELMSYDAAVRQCRLIVDKEACADACEKGGGKNCADTCGKPMNAPWYCANYAEVNSSTHKYNFPVLEQTFAFAPDKQKGMGLQEGYTLVATTNNKLEKSETASDINTTDTLDWQVTTNRTIKYKPYGDTTTNTETENVQSTVSQNKTQEQQTNW